MVVIKQPKLNLEIISIIEIHKELREYRHKIEALWNQYPLHIFPQEIEDQITSITQQIEKWDRSYNNFIENFLNQQKVAHQFQEMLQQIEKTLSSVNNADVIS